MTLYRATDAADTMNMAAMLIAAYCQDASMAKNKLDGFLQLGQQRNRASGPRDADHAQLAGLLGGPAPAGPRRPPPAPRSRGVVRVCYGLDQWQAEQAQRPEDDPTGAPVQTGTSDQFNVELGRGKGGGS